MFLSNFSYVYQESVVFRTGQFSTIFRDDSIKGQLYKTADNLRFYFLLWRISLSPCEIEPLGEETQEAVLGPKAWCIHKPISFLPVLIFM